MIWLVRCALGFVIVLSASRLLGASIWLGLEVAAAVVFVMSYAEQAEPAEDDEPERRRACEGRPSVHA